ncbi:arylamine N-acetyltransferase family protein [Desulforhopalus singaporensis]|uniref:arylamine N-acetyltransferase family protein n=1 Tax=Desulforhopalus singaporensis TaxID=91360 RepID=UPI000A3E0EF8|nr:arylamine N-acetyltransferase [Desulforhopalus singaporensis]
MKYSGSVKSNYDGLELLHRAQVGTIPFENFDIILGRGISLEPGALFDKLVRRPRGGYCFELNGLFLMALGYFGFDARPLLARVHQNGIPMGRGHQVSLVTIGKKSWLVDVGFGAPHLPAPVPLATGCSVTLDGQMFRLIDAEPFGIMLQTKKNDLWQDLYSLDLELVWPKDIAYGNHYTSTHPDSFFTFTCVAALPSSDGRVSLCNRSLKIISGRKQQVCELGPGQAYLDALKTYFGIDLDVSHDVLSGRCMQGQLEEDIAF